MSDTNPAVQPQETARGLKFRIYEEEGLHYLCSENKGADQLRSYMQKAVFLMMRLILNHVGSVQHRL